MPGGRTPQLSRRPSAGGSPARPDGIHPRSLRHSGCRHRRRRTDGGHRLQLRPRGGQSLAQPADANLRPGRAEAIRRGLRHHQRPHDHLPAPLVHPQLLGPVRTDPLQVGILRAEATGPRRLRRRERHPGGRRMVPVLQGAAYLQGIRRLVHCQPRRKWGEVG